MINTDVTTFVISSLLREKGTNFKILNKQKNKSCISLYFPPDAHPTRPLEQGGHPKLTHNTRSTVQTSFPKLNHFRLSYLEEILHFFSFLIDVYFLLYATFYFLKIFIFASYSCTIAPATKHRLLFGTSFLRRPERSEGTICHAFFQRFFIFCAGKGLINKTK